MKIIYTAIIMWFINISVWGQSSEFASGRISDSSGVFNITTITTPGEKVTWHKMITNIPNDYIEFFGTQNGIGSSALFLKALLISGALVPLDQHTYNYQAHLETTYPAFSKGTGYAVFIGDGKFNLLTAGLFSIYGLAFDDQRSLKTSSNIVEAVVSTGLLVQVLKRVCGRESPIAASHNSGRWELFPNLKKYQKDQPRYYAFPSGHISTLAATITVIANNYSDAAWIKPVGYSAIGLVGISLVSKGMHWYSDLPLGIYLGYTIGSIVAPGKKSGNDSNEPMLSFYPALSFKSSPGLGVIYNF